MFSFIRLKFYMENYMNYIHNGVILYTYKCILLHTYQIRIPRIFSYSRLLKQVLHMCIFKWCKSCGHFLYNMYVNACNKHTFNTTFVSSLSMFTKREIKWRGKLHAMRYMYIRLQSLLIYRLLPSKPMKQNLINLSDKLGDQCDMLYEALCCMYSLSLGIFAPAWSISLIFK